jgi:spore maturation protein CgeB
VRAIRALLPYGVAVYGPPDWTPLLPSALQDTYRGPLPYSELPDLFASSKINLNLHSLQCPDSLNPRDFDILASGGFLLSDYVSEADGGLLVDESHTLFFKHQTDLLEKTSLFLEDENRRRALAEAGHRHVLENHLLRHRAAEMMKQFNRIFEAHR